jgi:hypothetical protein
MSERRSVQAVESGRPRERGSVRSKSAAARRGSSENRFAKAIRQIREFRSKLRWKPLQHLLIDAHVWEYTTRRRGYDPRLIFCHPDLLREVPVASLYYRRLAGLSLKDAMKRCHRIGALEKDALSAEAGEQTAHEVAKIYNTVLCAVIKDTMRHRVARQLQIA